MGGGSHHCCRPFSPALFDQVPCGIASRICLRPCSMLPRGLTVRTMLRTGKHRSVHSESDACGQSRQLASVWSLPTRFKAACTGSNAAQGSLSEFEWQRVSDTVQRIHCLIEEGSRMDAGKCKLA